MSKEPGVREIPGALADYAAGVADVVARGLVVAAAPILLLALLALAVVGGGVALVVLAVLAPAIAAAVALEVPSRVRERFA
ncbi:hypothetical protein [Halobellus sp. H-GB7]|uniref:hypothetical protein n=1 Tax=Halobellus sp. H-GB7 TaxID=3069756 RepID=UPI0027AFBA15|nr:hypothetical protein [Halobellus sp. H-GB7]MDQ2054245.1 hypothetical protein [Halobellus sp. H-GB7]